MKLNSKQITINGRTYEFEYIKTWYDGILYKSRNEASYAVLLDYLGANPESKPETFCLTYPFNIQSTKKHHLEWEYTPDFKIENVYLKYKNGENRKITLYIEVKSKTDEDSAQKVKTLFVMLMNDPDAELIVFGDVPYPSESVGAVFNSVKRQQTDERKARLGITFHDLNATKGGTGRTLIIGRSIEGNIGLYDIHDDLKEQGMDIEWTKKAYYVASHYNFKSRNEKVHRELNLPKDLDLEYKKDCYKKRPLNI